MLGAVMALALTHSDSALIVRDRAWWIRSGAIALWLVGLALAMVPAFAAAGLGAPVAELPRFVALATGAAAIVAGAGLLYATPVTETSIAVAEGVVTIRRRRVFRTSETRLPLAHIRQALVARDLDHDGGEAFRLFLITHAGEAHALSSRHGGSRRLFDEAKTSIDALIFRRAVSGATPSAPT